MKINRVLFVSDENLEAIKNWPLELRAIFDPRAARELAERVEKARVEAEARWAKLNLDEVVKALLYDEDYFKEQGQSWMQNRKS